MNAGRKPLFIVDQDCLSITNQVVHDVELAGMQTVRSFDLDVVRSSNEGFCCQVHGKHTCTCQLVVLLIMLREGGILTMILEGKDQQTWIYLDLSNGAAEEQIDPSLTGALLHAFSR